MSLVSLLLLCSCLVYAADPEDSESRSRRASCDVRSRSSDDTSVPVRIRILQRLELVLHDSAGEVDVKEREENVLWRYIFVPVLPNFTLSTEDIHCFFHFLVARGCADVDELCHVTYTG